MTESLASSRRDLLLGSLVAALALGGRADAATLDPAMTIVQQFDDIKWETGLDRPLKTVEYAGQIKFVKP